MIKQLHKLMLLIVAALFTVDGYAYKDIIQINEITYKLYNDRTAQVVGYENDCKGDIIIPYSIYDVKTRYTVTAISYNAFEGCSGLTSISIPESVTEIDIRAFYGCNNLVSIEIPKSVKRIYEEAFAQCKSLTSVTLNSSDTYIESAAFAGCRIKAIYLLYHSVQNAYCISRNIPDDAVIFAYPSEFSNIKKYWKRAVADITKPYALSISKQYFGSIALTVVSNETIAATTLQGIKFSNSELTPDTDSIYTISGLEPDTSYDILIMHKASDGETECYTQTVNTAKPKITATLRNATQTTITLTVDAETDTTYLPAGRMGVRYLDTDYYCKDGKVIISDLASGKTIHPYPFAEYGTKHISSDNSYSCSTVSTNPDIVVQEIGPTSISVEGSYTVIDAHVSESGFTDRGTGNTMVLTGLTPNTSHTISYYVKTKEGGNETVTKTFTTSPKINFATLQPKCVSSTCAIVAAQTNISEEETGVGFQWKKYDAPESLKPNEGYAAIHDGQVEGYIKNLQPTSYYNVRAFYKSADGEYYYGDWVTFDPSDFSFFEPTVQTYGAKDVTENRARLNGYALAGTDEIEEQGFEYWKQGESEDKARSMHAEIAASAPEEDVHTLFATGQRMSVELRDLEPGTTYCYRAFVKTVLGKAYGQEETFKTLGLPTGIDDVMSDKTAPEIEGYYDLHGRKLSQPRHGMNIIRYTDGTARKVLMK